MRALRIVSIVIFAAILAAGGVFLWNWKQNADKEKRMAEFTRMRQNPDLAASGDEIVVPVDFTSLYAQNPDIYAWITIPGTSVDEPVLQSPEDGTYYLTHDAEKEENPSGAVFSETYNKKDFSDVHTVLYGQSTETESPFGELQRFGDEEFFSENRIISIFTPDDILQYQIFAAYLYDSRHLLQTYDCSDPAVFAAYIDQVLTQRNLYAQIDKDIEILPGDRILTLSTGHSKGSDYRFLVQGVLTEEQHAGS